MISPDTCHITYCSKDKDAAPGELPAVERYRSERIQLVRALALAQGGEFRILSGRFGLLRAEDPIPWYDHLLQLEEVAAMVEKVAPAFEPFQRVVFYLRPGDYIAPYVEVIRLAAARAGCAAEWREIATGD